MNNTTTHSHGMGLLIEALKKAKKTNDLTIYFNWLTDNRLSAHIIVGGRLVRLQIPEAGYKQYAGHKDGYQKNGGGYSKPQSIVEDMLFAVRKVLDCSDPCRYCSQVRYEVIN